MFWAKKARGVQHVLSAGTFLLQICSARHPWQAIRGVLGSTENVESVIPIKAFSQSISDMGHKAQPAFHISLQATYWASDLHKIGSKALSQTVLH
eukprot:1139091-Pelagomonas_calceolata.AAC.3